MPKSHRINITLSEGDYARLVSMAEARGMMPTTLAGDLVKNGLYSPSMLASKVPEIIETPPPLTGGSEIDIWTQQLPGVEEKPLSRQERRALERGKQKRRG